MKYILYLIITYGTATNQLSTLVTGPGYDTYNACKAAADQFSLNSELPIADAKFTCKPEKQAKNEPSLRQD